MILPKSVRNAIDEFSKLPGIGQKTASRLTFFLLHQKDEDVKRFGQAFTQLKENLTLCERCKNISESSLCHICSDPMRDSCSICIVGEPLDTVAIEKAGVFKGVYHVLHGNISPLDNIGPEDLTIDYLLHRIEKEKPEELILATNPTLEGEATASFISQKVKSFGIKITRIARGLPVGGDIEYADETTLMRALEGRMVY